MLFAKLSSIRVRLTAIFLAIFGTALVFFSSFVYTSFVHGKQNDFDAELFNYAVDISEDIRMDMFGNIAVSTDILATGGKIFPFSTGNTYLEVIDMSGRVVGRSKSLGAMTLPSPEPALPALLRDGRSYQLIPAPNPPATGTRKREPYRLLSYLVKRPDSAPFILQLAVSTAQVERSIEGFRNVIFIGVPLTLLFAALGGLLFSRRALMPISAIIEKARSLNASQLSQRIPVPAENDELRELSLTLNALLDRLQQAFESHERFIADASHELKTPLAIMRGEFDLLKKKVAEQPEIAESIESSSQELDSLSRIVEDLLLLARIEAGEGSLSFEEVRLDELALEVVSRLERIARAKSVKLRLDLVGRDESSGEFVVRADPGLLKSALKNLVENAIKFSPEAATVSILVEDRATSGAISVSDEGPGIPPEVRPKVFESFYRFNHPQLAGKKVPGAGLGLAICRRILDAHHGSIDILDKNPPGATFRIEIKKF